MPYAPVSAAARSGLRTAAITSDGATPALSMPESSASPILPAPRIAIMPPRLAPGVAGFRRGPSGPGGESVSAAARARRKNVRLAGRSASLRMK